MTLLYAKIKGANQPVHPHSLISASVIHFQDSRIPILAHRIRISEIYHGIENIIFLSYPCYPTQDVK